MKIDAELNQTNASRLRGTEFLDGVSGILDVSSFILVFPSFKSKQFIDYVIRNPLQGKVLSKDSPLNDLTGPSFSVY